VNCEKLHISGSGGNMTIRLNWSIIVGKEMT
jgi:hypothetical protein